MKVARKTIERARLFTELLRKTVEREIRILRALRHPAVVELLEVIETDTAIHMVLEYVSGGNLQQLVAARGHRRCQVVDDARVVVAAVAEVEPARRRERLRARRERGLVRRQLSRFERNACAARARARESTRERFQRDIDEMYARGR